MPPRLSTEKAAEVSLRTAWWCLRAPYVFTRALARAIVQAGGTWALATRDSIVCRGCEGELSLVGRWECGWCGYVFDGFAFARCEVCGAVPPFIECQTCGIGFKNPTLFP
jgi:hypothetical protein